VAARFYLLAGTDIIGGRMRGQGEIIDAVFERDDELWELINGIFA
jgi:hypothetical protein